MATPLLPLGVVTVVVQNTVYALPPRRVLMFSPDASPTYFQSNDSAFALSVAVTLTGGQAELAGAFIRCTSASPTTIMLKGF